MENNRLTFSEWTKLNKSKPVNFSQIGKLKRILKEDDTYEKLKKLEKIISKFKGNKKNLIYKYSLLEFDKLKKIEKKLLAEKKKRIERKYSNDTIQPKVSLTISRSDLDLLIDKLYASYIDTKKFKKQCKALKIILTKFLANYKANGNFKYYKKYYSVYIDVCEFLENNFSYINK